MKGEKNCYFLIKVCSVCFSITQHMSDQHHWWAHQTKKCLRLAPPFAWTVICCRTPSPHVWIVNLNLVPNPHLSRKSFPSTLPRFSSASSLIFICFFMFTPGGRSLTPQACLSVNLARENFRCMFLRRKGRFSFFFFFCQYFQILPAGPQLETSSFQARGCFSESAHFLLFVSVCVWQQLLCWAASHCWDKVKTQLLPLMNKLTVWQEKQISFPNSLLESVFSGYYTRGSQGPFLIDWRTSFPDRKISTWPKKQK